MPGMDGIKFLKAVRAQYPVLPFIIFTGRGREEVAMEALNCGADRYIQKGGDPKSQFTELIFPSGAPWRRGGPRKPSSISTGCTR